MEAFRRLRSRVRRWSRDLLTSLVTWLEAGSAAQLVAVRVDDGTPGGHLYRHLNIGRVDYEIHAPGPVAFMVLVDYWGNRVAEYRMDKVLARRNLTHRSLGSIRLPRVVRL